MFEIDGTAVAEPARDGITITDEPIWAANTGRNTKGKMIGDLVDWKRTIEVTWPPLTYAQAWKIRKKIMGAGAFFEIAYKDVNITSGTAEDPITIQRPTVYCANIPRTLYSLSPKYPRYDGITIQFVEQ